MGAQRNKSGGDPSFTRPQNTVQRGEDMQSSKIQIRTKKEDGRPNLEGKKFRRCYVELRHCRGHFTSLFRTCATEDVNDEKCHEIFKRTNKLNLRLMDDIGTGIERSARGDSKNLKVNGSTRRPCTVTGDDFVPVVMQT